MHIPGSGQEQKEVNMPYIKVKAFPKDEETKKIVADGINKVFMNHWGCPQEAITVSFEEVEPEKWDEEVKAKEITPNADKMMILDGEKKY